VHPDGPVAAARAAAMLGPARAALAAEAAALRRRLAALAAAERLEAGGAAALAEAAAAAAAARERLRLALVAEAEPGPPAPDSAAAALVRESETLSGLAARVAGAPTGSGPARMSARNAPGEATVVPLLAPVVGIVQRGFAEPDAGGVRHPGLTLATLPRALVTAPADGVVRYVGPFLEHGTVAVIEIAPATMVVLAGIEAMAVSAGDPVAAGEPIGFLGGRDPAPQDYLMATGHGSDAFTRETIYMEVWQRTEPVDPEPWLAAGSG
jgi:murein hydrolase activator